MKVSVKSAILAGDFVDEICACITAGEVSGLDRVISKSLYKELQNQDLCDYLAGYVNHKVHNETSETVNAVISVRETKGGYVACVEF